MFFSLAKANLKRLTKYIPGLIISVLLLLAICMSAALFISKNIYKEKTKEPVRVAYYIPEDDNLTETQIAVSVLENTRSMQEQIELVRVFNVDDGYEMLDNNEALYFLIIPENFLNGILYGQNTPLEIVTKDSSSINSHVINDLFLSYGTYLGLAQAAVYSVLDVTYDAGYSQEEISYYQNFVNTSFMDRSLNKLSYMDEKTATLEGQYSLLQHYTASAVMLVLFFSGFVLMPFMQRYSSGIHKHLEINQIGKVQLFIQNVFYIFLALIIAYVPCHLVIGIYQKSINTSQLYYIPAVAFIISLIIALIGTFCSSEFSGNMTVLIVALLIAYIGGGIMPKAFLPKAVDYISDYLPGKFLLSCLKHCLFGGSYVI